MAEKKIKLDPSGDRLLFEKRRISLPSQSPPWKVENGADELGSKRC
jgi:hypothetical protein